ncbi:MAG TPA: dephospho-CoA kinase [Nitrospiraceae bacterium]|nr:dephospho-CoA kinase [Nitrospiraceae bacterium]
MGKSTILAMFREVGAVTIESDRIVDTLLNDETVLRKLREILGDDVFSPEGRLDKAKVADAIFQSKKLRDAVESVLHPLVFEKIRDFLHGLEEERRDAGVVVIEIPLLFEKGYAGMFHRAITVFTGDEIALKRLEKKGIGRQDALKRLNAQMPIQEKMRMSDFTIDNSCSLDDTRTQVIHIYAMLLEEPETSCENPRDHSKLLRDE